MSKMKKPLSLFTKATIIVVALIAVMIGLVLLAIYSGMKNQWMFIIWTTNIITVGIVCYLYRINRDDKTSKGKKDLKFLRFYYVFIFVLTVFGIVETIFKFGLPIDSVLTYSTIVLSIIAIKNFRRHKLPAITQILPFAYVICAIIVLSIGFLTLTYYLMEIPILSNKLNNIVLISNRILDVFTLILSAYIIKRFVWKK